MSPQAKPIAKASRYIHAYLLVAALVVIFGGSILPTPVFAIVLLFLGTAFGVIWLWLVTVIPPAAIETLREGNYHPDANVRALQKGEITIEEYVQRTSSES